MDMDFYCSHCKKQYASYKSLWNHKKKFHNTNINTCKRNINDHINDNQQGINNIVSNSDKSYNCRHCNKQFRFLQARHRHEKTCKIKDKKEKEKEQELYLEEKRLELEIKKEEAKIKKEENENLRLKLKEKGSHYNKETALTVQKINKALQLQNSNINSHNTINNNQHIVQNFQLIQLGKERDVPLMLTNQEKSKIVNSRRFALQKIVEILHGGSGDYKQFKNLIVTNLRNKYIYKYDDTKESFILANAEDVMALLIDNRLSDLETIYDQYVNKISPLTKKSLERFINEIKEHDSDSRKLEIEQIKMLLFNDRDKIMTDLQDEISLVLTVNEV